MIDSANESESRGPPPAGDEENTPSSILAKINHARRELLDLTTRNRLLSAPRHTKRAKTIEVVDELCDEVYRILVTEGRKVSFLPRSSEADDSAGGEEPTLDGFEHMILAMPPDEEEGAELAARHTDHHLQTTFDSAFLQKRLLALHYDGRSALEEQGFNILYLAIGFLKWIDPNQDKERYAPLILVPITIERTSAQSRFKVEYSGEEISTNLSLREKLQSAFGIELPALPEPEDLVPTEYFRMVGESVEATPGWETLPNDMVVGIFSFSKLLMHRDLDPDNWPEGKNITEHPLLVGLLGDGLSEEPHYEDDVNVDGVTDPADLPHVMDADSSQTMAIEEVRRGKNLVIQGPPGTGKSQTITNVIAAAVREGKSVLFVAEKRAALDVVKRRLDNIALGDMCLELHSHKASKKVVLEELGRTLRLGPPTVAAGRVSDELRVARDSLNRHAKLMHTAIEPSGVTPYRAIGTIALLRGRGAVAPDFKLAAAANWTSEEYAAKHDLVRAQANLLPSLGKPTDHPWRGVGVETMLPMDLERLSTRLKSARSAVLSCIEVTVALSDLLGAPGSTLDAAREQVRFAEFVSAAPLMDVEAITDLVWSEQREAIDELVKVGEALSVARQTTSSVLKDSAWSEDLGAVRKDYARHGSSLFRMLNASYRAARSELRSYVKDKLPQPAAAIRLLDALRVGQDALARLDESNELGQSAFGDQWSGEKSPWPRLLDIAKWDRECREAALPADHREVPRRLTERESLPAAAAEVARHADEAQQQVDLVFTELILDCEPAFGCSTLGVVPLGELDHRLRAWQEEPGRLHHWITFRERDQQIREAGLGPIWDLAWDGGAEAAGPVDLLVYARNEAILARAWEAHPGLRDFDGLEHDRLVEEFKSLEIRKMTLSRAEVALAHHEGVPRGGSIGEVATIRMEINKQRRHLPIRKLIRLAGRAMQKIKLVFMMSPMSVAQYLAPGTLEFDLLVIDEASQVRPVEALGVLARCSQAVVVGDKKQLPPTRFFDSLIELVDEEEEDDASFQAGDLESVLALCEAQGLPSKMLRWHYRSRHESLIAVSNRAFYNDKLFIVPSPVSGDDLGIAFHHLPGAIYDRGGSRTNRTEAEKVADAVVTHAENNPQRTLGVGTFSVAQRDAILDEIELRRRGRPDVEEFFAEGGAEPFFVKNLETIQGDERDVIFLSIGYGPDASGYMAMSFGPLSSDGGQRRLNVLMSRARERMEVFSAITADSIDLTRTQSEGVGVLKTFLRYTQTGILGTSEPTGREPDSDFEEEVGRALTMLGHTVVHQVGTAGFFIDLAVVDPSNPGRYSLGIECDGATYHSSRSARDRDRLRQAVLEDRGWRIHRVWSTDWFKNPDAELRKIQKALQDYFIVGVAPNRPETTRVAPSSGGDGLDRGAQAPEFTDSIATDPYQEADFHFNDRRDLHEVPRGRLSEIVVDVVEVEGPIHSDELARRLATLWGLSRAGGRIRSAVGDALAHAKRLERVEMDGSFASSPGSSLVKPRNRASVSSPTLLKADMLPPSEIRLAAIDVVRIHVGASTADVVVEVTRVFGFKRAGPDLKRVIEAEIRRMLYDDVIALREDRIYLGLETQ